MIVGGTLGGGKYEHQYSIFLGYSHVIPNYNVHNVTNNIITSHNYRTHYRHRLNTPVISVPS